MVFQKGQSPTTKSPDPSTVRASEPLQNEQWERFAQARAEGLSLIKCHQLAGYTPNIGNAGTLSKKPLVKARIDFLKEKMAVNAEENAKSAYEEAVNDLVAAKLKIDKAYIQAQLIKNLAQARAMGNIKEGNAALKLLGETCQAFEPDPNDGKDDARKALKHDPDGGARAVSLLTSTLEDVEQGLGDFAEDGDAVVIDDELRSTETDPMLKPR